MGNRKEYHVVPGNDCWKVVKNNASKASSCTSLKTDAIAIAKQFSQKTGSELVIHGKDGKIQSSNSYGKDPCPPKDRK